MPPLFSFAICDLCFNLRDVSSLLICFREHPTDPRKARGSDQLHPLLTSIFHELDRWELVPQWREPLTVEMLLAVDDTKAFSKHAFPSKWVAIADWSDCGIRTGFQKTELHKEITTLTFPTLY